MAHRFVCGFFLLVFLASMAVQYNDPDGPLWIAIYAVGFVLTAAHLLKQTLYLPQAVGALGSAVGAIYIYSTVDTLEADKVLASFQMQGLGVEEFREAIGLVIQALWLAYLALRAWRARS